MEPINGLTPLSPANTPLQPLNPDSPLYPAWTQPVEPITPANPMEKLTASFNPWYGLLMEGISTLMDEIKKCNAEANKEMKEAIGK